MAQSGSIISAEMEAISHVLSLVEAFRAFDSNNDGQITAAELGGIMGSLGYNPREQDVKAMMQQGDMNKDGLLSLEEFLEMNTKGMELGSLATCLQLAFQELNGDEAITGEELFQVLESTGAAAAGISLENCMNIIASMDGNGDGVVDYEDFKLIVNCLL